MKRFTCLLLALLAGAEANAESTAIVNVNVLPMTSGAVLGNKTVVVSDGVIMAIGDVEDTPVPEDAVIVDGTDRFLIPGLAEMHGHVPGADSDSLERVLTLFVANGVTTVRGMLGQPSHLTLRKRIADGSVLGPRLFTSGPSLNGRSVASPEAGAGMVRAQFDAGYDFLKIHPGLTRDEFDAIAAKANELGMPFAGHVPEDVGIERALASGIATIDHLDGYMPALLRPNEDPSGGLGGFFGVFIAGQADESKIAELARRTAGAGTWNVPTESLFEHVTDPELPASALADRVEMRYMPAFTVDQWIRAKSDLLSDSNYDPDVARRAIRLRQQLIVALHEAGAGLLLGSDSPQIFNVPGYAIHHELRYLVDAGLSPLVALQTGTVNAATYLGQSEVFGRIEEGYEADLVLLDANPLADIGNSRRVHGVMLRGQWLSRAELDRRLQRLERRR